MSLNMNQERDLSKSIIENLIVDADGIIDWINVNLNPEDVFDSEALEIWAEDNDWHKNY